MQTLKSSQVVFKWKRTLEINNNTFKTNKHIDENGLEFWYARKLYKILKYTEWRNIKKVINKSIILCKSSNVIILHFYIYLNSH